MEEKNKDIEKVQEQITKEAGKNNPEDDVVMVVDNFDEFLKKAPGKSEKSDDGKNKNTETGGKDSSSDRKSSNTDKKDSKDGIDSKDDKKAADTDKKDSKDGMDSKGDKKAASADKIDSKNGIDSKGDKKSSDTDKKDSKDNIDSKADKKDSTTDKKADTVSDKKTDKTESDKNSNAVSQSKKIEDAKRAAENAKVSDSTSVISSNKKEKSSGAKKGILIGLSIVAGLVLIAYVSGFIYFSTHFYQDVEVNGINVSGMNRDSAKSVLDNFYKSYKLTMTTIDKEEVDIVGKDIAASVKLRDEFSDCFKAQQPSLWFVNMFDHHDYMIGADASWDENLLEKKLSSFEFLDEKNMTAPENAYVGIVDGKFEIVKEILGTTIKKDVFDSELKNSLQTVQSKLDLVEAGCYDLPTVYSDNEELKKDLDAKNEFAKNIIKIQMDDLTIEPGMELYEDVLEKNGDKYTVSKTKVTKYVNDLANQYDSMGKDRTFTTSYNSKKITITGTAFGYELDKDATVNKLYSALTAGKSSTVEAEFITKGKSLKNEENDIGDTYVEVNLSEQRVIGYKNGKKVAEGDCVSGNESLGRGTSTGLYEIQNKLSPTVLRGEKRAVTKTTTKKNKKGKKVTKTTTSYEYEYESPVTYWMQFNGGQGLHDAAGWRSAYGGNIYYYSGSHGCVNLPLDLAKTLYDNFEVGDPVIVYFWDNENRK